MASSKLELLGIKSGSDISKILEKYVDDSHYSLEEWAEALEEFSEWCGQKGRSFEAAGALDYIHCCAAAATRFALKPRLWEMVSEMLNVYGWENRKESC